MAGKHYQWPAILMSNGDASEPVEPGGAGAQYRDGFCCTAKVIMRRSHHGTRLLMACTDHANSKLYYRFVGFIDRLTRYPIGMGDSSLSEALRQQCIAAHSGCIEALVE